MKVLIAIPVFNEERYVRRVLGRVLEYAEDVLVIDDGSMDRTREYAKRLPVTLIEHERNMGYGRSLADAFAYAQREGYDWLITMDCDEQHEPAAIPTFVREAQADRVDIVSGSRYYHARRAEDPQGKAGDEGVPADRKAINGIITDEINELLGFGITDAFCGFKAYRVAKLGAFEITQDGYAMPMQLWVQAAAAGLRVGEVPVELIYNDLTRSFGGRLDDPEVRLAHYRAVLHAELAAQRERVCLEPVVHDAKAAVRTMGRWGCGLETCRCSLGR